MTGHVVLGLVVALVLGFRSVTFFVLAGHVDGSLRNFALARGVARLGTGIAAGLIIWNVWFGIPAFAMLLADVVLTQRVRRLD